MRSKRATIHQQKKNARKEKIRRDAKRTARRAELEGKIASRNRIRRILANAHASQVEQL